MLLPHHAHQGKQEYDDDGGDDGEEEQQQNNKNDILSTKMSFLGGDCPL